MWCSGVKWYPAFMIECAIPEFRSCFVGFCWLLAQCNSILVPMYKQMCHYMTIETDILRDEFILLCLPQDMYAVEKYLLWNCLLNSQKWNWIWYQSSNTLSSVKNQKIKDFSFSWFSQCSTDSEMHALVCHDWADTLGRVTTSERLCPPLNTCDIPVIFKFLHSSPAGITSTDSD